MAQVENAPPSIAIKLVYCGPFGSGKTTNLNQLYSRLNDRYRSRMLSLDPTQTTDAELLYHTRPVDADHRPARDVQTKSAGAIRSSRSANTFPL